MRHFMMSTIPGVRPVLLAGCLGLALGLSVTARAHPDPDAEADRVTVAIEAAPGRADLVLRRAELHRARRSWQAAEADYRRARALDPRLDVVDLCLGRMLLDAARPAEALAPLDRYLAAHPDHVEARVTRARVLARLGLHQNAAREWTRALTHASDPRPEHYLDRAQSLAASRPARLAEALAGLEEGCHRLGHPIALELAAVDLEARLGRVDGALRRLGALEARSPRKEAWAVRRAKLLQDHDRTDEARAAWAQARAAIDRLPASRRATPAVKRLEDEVRAALVEANR